MTQTPTSPLAEDRATHGLPAPYPCEDLEAGLYLHGQNTNLTVITPPNGEPVVLVAAEDFMETQRQRDDYRRAVALINAWRATPGRSEARLRQLLLSVGETDASADAMRGLIAWAEAERAEDLNTSALQDHRP